jgi:hypothetical protein
MGWHPAHGNYNVDHVSGSTHYQLQQWSQHPAKFRFDPGPVKYITIAAKMIVRQSESDKSNVDCLAEPLLVSCGLSSVEEPVLLQALFSLTLYTCSAPGPWQCKQAVIINAIY